MTVTLTVTLLTLTAEKPHTHQHHTWNGLCTTCGIAEFWWGGTVVGSPLRAPDFHIEGMVTVSGPGLCTTSPFLKVNPLRRKIKPSILKSGEGGYLLTNIVLKAWGKGGHISGPTSSRTCKAQVVRIFACFADEHREACSAPASSAPDFHIAVVFII